MGQRTQRGRATRQSAHPAIAQGVEALAKTGQVLEPVGELQHHRVTRRSCALDEPQAIADVAQATRHYAKRQFTWFKKEQGAVHVAPGEALEAILSGA